MAQREKLLGDFSYEKKEFLQKENILKTFSAAAFLELNEREKFDRVNYALFTLIEKEKDPCFLLPEVVDFIAEVNNRKIFSHYSFMGFELWLNQYSQLSFDKNYHIRAKISGKYLPRDEYCTWFPISMKKVYGGTHFVTAHKSADLDSTVASFWGWIDAFAARVSQGLHIWNIPDGPPQSQIEIDLIFKQVFGASIFKTLAKNYMTLGVTSIDLMTQQGFIKKKVQDTSESVDHDENRNAIVIVDDQGYYLGDWRSYDVEAVRKVLFLWDHCLRWFENNLYVNLISLFAKKDLLKKDIPEFLSKLFFIRIKDCAPAKGYSLEQKRFLQDFLTEVLGVTQGANVTFKDLGKTLFDKKILDFALVPEFLQSNKNEKIFDSKGKLIEDRTKIFLYFEKVVKKLQKAFDDIRLYMEKIEIALLIKTKVLHLFPCHVSMSADLDEIRRKMQSYHYLVVTSQDKGKLLPVGVIYAKSLRSLFLGSVSLRDFSSSKEMKISSHLDVISVVDHHKINLHSFMPPCVVLSDAQATNSLLGELAFSVNDTYSISLSKQEGIYCEKLKTEKDFSAMRICKRLLQKKINAQQKGHYFVHPKREFLEYLHFLYGILDDTDLLMKVSHRDVKCIASLLNRLKSLFLKKEVEIISLDDIAQDENFAQVAARRILQNKDMYSLYKKVYLSREKKVEENIQLCLEDKPSTIFSDVKIQNGSCRIGQTKMFVKNISLFEKSVSCLRKKWYLLSQAIFEEQKEMDLHMHMISTIRGAEEVYSGHFKKYSHLDELWIWIAPSDIAASHLQSFLSAFASSKHMNNAILEVEFLGDNYKDLDQIFVESGIEIERKIYPKKKNGLPICIIRYPAGWINSRKGMISPFLPHS